MPTGINEGGEGVLRQSSPYRTSWKTPRRRKTASYASLHNIALGCVSFNLLPISSLQQQTAQVYKYLPTPSRESRRVYRQRIVNYSCSLQVRLVSLFTIKSICLPKLINNAGDLPSNRRLGM